MKSRWQKTTQVITEINKLVRRFGLEEVKHGCSKFVTQTREYEKNLRKKAEAEKELAKINTKLGQSR